MRWFVMRSILLALLSILIVAGPAPAQTPSPGAPRLPLNWTDPDLGRAVIEGAATSRFLWLRGASKAVVRFDRQTGERSVAATDVLDILADGPHLWALIEGNANEGVVRDIRRPDIPDRRIYFEGNPIALFATGAEPGVLTDTRVLLPSTEGWSRQPLAANLDRYAHVSAPTGGALFVGYNKGEWGGGLRRVDMSTGAISFVQEPGAALCGGLLNPACAPVVGIVPDRERQDCVLVGSSLAHLSSRSGQVLRVCGASITSVFADPLQTSARDLGGPGQTWPFDSLTATHDGWIAVGQDRFARSRGGTVRMSDVPPLQTWAGLRISSLTEGVLFLQAACCWGSDSFVQYRVIAIPVED